MYKYRKCVIGLTYVSGGQLVAEFLRLLNVPLFHRLVDALFKARLERKKTQNLKVGEKGEQELPGKNYVSGPHHTQTTRAVPCTLHTQTTCLRATPHTSHTQSTSFPWGHCTAAGTQPFTDKKATQRHRWLIQGHITSWTKTNEISPGFCDSKAYALSR